MGRPKPNHHTGEPDLMLDMTPAAYRAIFEGGDTPRHPDAAPATHRPEDMFDVAAAIQDLFVQETPDADIIPVNPPISRVEPLARRLLQLTAHATNADANVRLALIAALNSAPHRGRADEIKSAARQLADAVFDVPALDRPVPDDDLPF